MDPSRGRFPIRLNRNDSPTSTLSSRRPYSRQDHRGMHSRSSQSTHLTNALFLTCRWLHISIDHHHSDPFSSHVRTATRRTHRITPDGSHSFTITHLSRLLPTRALSHIAFTLPTTANGLSFAWSRCFRLRHRHRCLRRTWLRSSLLSHSHATTTTTTNVSTSSSAARDVSSRWLRYR